MITRLFLYVRAKKKNDTKSDTKSNTKSDTKYRRVGIGTGMRAISINGVPPFLSIARNLLLSDALFQLLRTIIGEIGRAHV